MIRKSELDKEKQDGMIRLHKEDAMYQYEGMTKEEIEEMEDFLAELELQRSTFDEQEEA